MKVFIAEECESYEQSTIFGVFATKEAAEKAWAEYVADIKADYELGETCYIDRRYLHITEREVRE